MKEQVFGNRYKVTGKVGSGGMANVYKAYDSVLNRTVALKTLHSQFAQEEDFVARFRREAQAAANLNHPNIVNIYDWGKEQNSYFIVMEYLEGESLKQIIKKRGPLSPGEAIAIVGQVCDALEVAHEHDVIHRDIKPENIIIDSKGKVKVTDFGIARAGASSKMTQTGTIIGTAQYISPEQAQGGAAQGQSDLYSLGIVLYEMVTGKVPFEEDTPIATALKQVNEMPTPPREINPEVPKPLEAVILKALAKDPALRYQRAPELKQDLDRVSQGLPVEAVIPPSRAETRVMKRPVPPAGQPRRTAKKPKKKRKALAWIGASFIIIALLIALVWGISSLSDLLLGEPVAVPNIKEKTVGEAEATLKEQGLKLKIVKRKYSSKTELDHIISQDPKPGEKLRKGGFVEVVVSKGKQEIEIPNVVGKDLGQATFILGQAGLEIGEIKEVYSSTTPDDTVISQEPQAGEKVSKGTVVNLVVSKGTKKVEVPDVVGKTSGEASAVLGQAGFKVKQVTEPSSTVAQGRVIRTVPAGGTPTKSGSTVTIVVSSGPEMVTVPNVVGRTESNARSTLEGRGFRVNSQSTSGTLGEVISQDPSGGTAPRGSTVVIYVGDGS